MVQKKKKNTNDRKSEDIDACKHGSGEEDEKKDEKHDTSYHRERAGGKRYTYV